MAIKEFRICDICGTFIMQFPGAISGDKNNYEDLPVYYELRITGQNSYTGKELHFCNACIKEIINDAL